MKAITFHTRLESNIIKLFNIDNLIGKEVIVSIIEVPNKQEKKKKKWDFIGAVKLDKQLDQINIRDFAHE